MSLDQIASDYQGRYSQKNAYHYYFFNERLQAALSGHEVAGKTILDIGAGTGALYDELKKGGTSFTYYACDISRNMLEKSKIPLPCRYVGTVMDIDFPVCQFDYVFMLGVTSYMSETEFKNTLLFIEKHLPPGGKAIISFTHRHSLDFQIRRFLKFLNVPKFIKSANARVIGQDFSIKAYSCKEIQNMVGPNFKWSDTVWLNQTISPFNHWLPKLSIQLAGWIKNKMPDIILPYFSGDFLVMLEKFGPT